MARTHPAPAAPAPSTPGAQRALLLLLALVVMVAPGAAQGQTIVGRVLDGADDSPVAAARILVLDGAGAVLAMAEANREGRFALREMAAGRLTVRVEAFGYDSNAAAELVMPQGEDLFVEIRVWPSAFTIEPVIVSAPRLIPFLDATGFYDRRRRGHGTFFGPQEIERYTGTYPTQLLRRVPGVSVTRDQILVRGAGNIRDGLCPPRVLLDGIVLAADSLSLDDVVPMADILAMEVYRGAATLPPQWRSHGTCGLIVIWTRH